jgi:F420-0:gamma-glutamyl ligase
VVVADIDGDAAERVAAGLRANGHEALGLRCDVAYESDTIAVVDAAVAAYGQIDIFCANAGIDLSNVERGWAALLPIDSDRSARRIGPRGGRRRDGARLVSNHSAAGDAAGVV